MDATVQKKKERACGAAEDGIRYLARTGPEMTCCLYRFAMRRLSLTSPPAAIIFAMIFRGSSWLSDRSACWSVQSGIPAARYGHIPGTTPSPHRMMPGSWVTKTARRTSIRQHTVHDQPFQPLHFLTGILSGYLLLFLPECARSQSLTWPALCSGITQPPTTCFPSDGEAGHSSQCANQKGLRSDRGRELQDRQSLTEITRYAGARGE